MKKFFVYKCKLSLSLGQLYLVDLFINKLKTKFNILFYRMILNAKRIHSSFNFNEISPQGLNKCLQKFYFRQEKATTADVRSLGAKIAIIGDTKTKIYRSGGGWYLGREAAR